MECDDAFRAQFAQRSAPPLPPQSLQFKEPNVSTFPSIHQLYNGFYRASVMHCH